MKKRLPPGPSPEDLLIKETIETALAGADLLERLSNADPETEPERIKEMAEAIRMVAAAVAGLTHTAV